MNKPYEEEIVKISPKYKKLSKARKVRLLNALIYWATSELTELE